MLKGLHPLLTADVLHALRAAGHGDEIVIVDCNFPAASTAKSTVLQAPVLLAGATADAVVDAVCSVLPLDFFEPHHVWHMCPDEALGGANAMPPLGQAAIDACIELVHKHNPDTCDRIRVKPIPRDAFYKRAQQAFVIIHAAGERRPYANVIMRKGVIGVDGKDVIPF